MLDLILVTLILLIGIHWFQSRPFIWRNAGIPYSVPWPIVGNAGKGLFKPFYAFFEELYMKMGDSPAYGFHLFGSPTLVVGDPNMVKQITVTKADHFMSHGFHSDPDNDPVGKSIFFVNGEEWRTVRSKLTPYFTPSRLKGMLPIITPSAEKFVDQMKKLGKLGPVNVEEMTMKLAVDVIVSTAFGLKPDSFDNPDPFFFKLQQEMANFSLGVKVLIGTMSPALYKFAGLKVFSNSITQKLIQLVKSVIQQRENNIGTRPDFLQGMVELKQKENLKGDTEKQFNLDGTPVAKFNDFTVAGQCVLMYAAGTETTGSTLSFLLYELALNQDIQDKAREEINDMITKTNNQYGFEDLRELKYLLMIFHETMRKYPIVSAYGRQCTRNVNIDGIDIPVGTLIMFSPYAMHKNPKYFPNPEKFIPERFEDEKNITPGSYIPYGMGPRTCIGIKLSELEILLALCKLLPQIKVTPSSKTEVPPTMSGSPTLGTKFGTWLTVEEII